MEDPGDGISQDEVSDEDVRNERDQKIAAMYETHSADQIARHFGLATPTIYLITKKLGLSKKKGRAPKAFNDLSLGNNHVKVGNRFAHHTRFIMKMEAGDVAKKLGWSPQKVALIAKGHHDLTLTDMITMAALMGTTVSALLDDI